MSKEIDSEGVDLSGGQKQRIALARAFYRNTDIIILDEPTAALDPVSEKIVFDKINRMAKDKTVIFVSHRIMSTMFCDKIILVENGRIIEMGTHKELMSMNGTYAELYNLQAGFMPANVQGGVS